MARLARPPPTALTPARSTLPAAVAHVVTPIAILFAASVLSTAAAACLLVVVTLSAAVVVIIVIATAGVLFFVVVVAMMFLLVVLLLLFLAFAQDAGLPGSGRVGGWLGGGSRLLAGHQCLHRDKGPLLLLCKKCSCFSFQSFFDRMLNRRRKEKIRTMDWSSRTIGLVKLMQIGI